VLVEDGAVPRTVLPQALRRIKEIAEENELEVALLFHAGDGNLHPQIIFDERNPEQTKKVKAAGYKMLNACVELGGTISGEHGIGLDKREAMKWLFGRETLSLFRRLKTAFDPLNLCNSDKLLPLVGKVEMVKAPPTSGPEQVVSWSGMAPETEEEAINTVSKWAGEHAPFGIQGTKTKYAVNESHVLQLQNLCRVMDSDQGNLTITVQAGARVADIRTLVEKDNQYLWVAGEGTIGGVVATCSSVSPPL
jgi:FAD/FMN-containing dehydrogenase